jgi:hypothetical protein
MKTTYSFLFLTVLFFPFWAQAQNDSFIFTSENSWGYNKKGIKIDGAAFAGSNSLNTLMFTEVLTQPTFSEKSKNAFLDRSQSRTNLFASNDWGVEFYKDSNTHFFVRNNNFQAFSSEKDISELFFFGNSPFRGQKIVTDGLNYVQANTLTTGFGFDVFKSKKLRIKSTLGFSTLNNYRQVDAKYLHLYTATDGSYLDMNFDGVSIVEANAGIQGIGLSSSVRVDYLINESNTLSFVANNINGFYLFDNQEIKIDTSFVFNGVPFDIFDADASISGYLDSAYDETINRNKATKKGAMLPTQLNFKWTHKLSSKSSFVSSFEAVSMGKFGVYAQLAFINKHSNRLKTKTCLGYGNFREFSWCEALEYRVKDYSFYLGVNNLQAIVVPTKTSNYGLSVGLFKQM